MVIAIGGLVCAGEPVPGIVGVGLWLVRGESVACRIIGIVYCLFRQLLPAALKHDGKRLDQAVEFVVGVEILIIQCGPA